MLSNCINLGVSCRSMCLSEAICRFRARCRSFSACFRMRLRARLILNAPDGVTGLSALVAAYPVNLIASPLDPAYSVAESVAAIRALWPARSWSSRIRRSRCGSGLHTCSPLKHPAYRLFNFSGNSGCRATRPPSRFFTSCALAWCDRIRIVSAVSQKKSSRPMKPTLGVVRAAWGAASTIWSSWHVPSKLGSASIPVASTSERPGGTPVVSGSPSCRTEVPNHWAVLSKGPWHRVPPLSPTTGAVTRSWASSALVTPPSRSEAICKLRKPFCPSFISCSPISKLGCEEPTTVSALSTYRRISTSSPSVSTAAFTHSTPSVLYSALRVMSPPLPMLSSMLKNHVLLHLVGGCDNRISTVDSSFIIYQTTVQRTVVVTVIG